LPSRWIDPQKSIGDLPEGQPLTEWTPPAQLPQFNGRIVETIPSVTLPTVEEALRLHSRALDALQRRPIALASFKTNRSLRRA
jgi:hypothetical protein